MIVSDPPLLLEYMMPTFATASPVQPVTWHQDMATAMSNAINNFLGNLQFKWGGTVSATYSFPLGGNKGYICEKVNFSSGEVFAACSGGDGAVVGLFALITQKMTQQFTCMLGTGGKSSFVPLVFTPQTVFFAGTNFIAEAGLKAYQEMHQPAETYQDNPYLFYEIMDKYLAQALNKCVTVISASGPATGGAFTGTAVLKPNVKTTNVSSGK